ncbi:MAG TPA: 50S ribosomal protein L21 [Rhizomicrobium sp.]|jgi:large subunit ribosomal protein L21
MFAVVRTGGKQYRVAENDVISVGKLTGDVGGKVALDVLMLGGDQPKSGSPLVDGASVEAEIVEHGRGPKVIAFKKKRRKNTHRKRGSRAHFTTLKITGISASKE